MQFREVPKAEVQNQRMIFEIFSKRISLKFQHGVKNFPQKILILTLEEAISCNHLSNTQYILHYFSIFSSLSSLLNHSACMQSPYNDFDLDLRSAYRQLLLFRSHRFLKQFMNRWSVLCYVMMCQ